MIGAHVKLDTTKVGDDSGVNALEQIAAHVKRAETRLRGGLLHAEPSKQLRDRACQQVASVAGDEEQ